MLGGFLNKKYNVAQNMLLRLLLLRVLSLIVLPLLPTFFWHQRLTYVILSKLMLTFASAERD